MFSFGSWVLFTGILRTIFDNIYVITIGKLFPAAQLGFYTKAQQFQHLGSNQLVRSVNVVAFPVFSRFQDNRDKLIDAISRFLKYSMSFIAPIMITLIVVAEPFIILVLTEKWSPMIPYLRLLCIIGFIYPVHSVNIQALMAQGKSNLNFNLATIKNALRILSIVIMYRYGVLYIILGEILVSVIALFINAYYSKKLIDYGLFKQIKVIKKTLIIAIISGILSYAI
jgi:O-antigen/teichoic acid export membrane protein